MGEARGYQPPMGDTIVFGQSNKDTSRQIQETKGGNTDEDREIGETQAASSWLEANRGTMPAGVYETFRKKLGGSGTETLKMEVPKRDVKPSAPVAQEATVAKSAVAERPNVDNVDTLANEKGILFSKLLEAGLIRQGMFEKLTDDERTDKLGPFLDMLSEVSRNLDANGDSQFSDQSTWTWLKRLAKDAYGIEIIYPTPGTQFSAMDCELSSVERNSKYGSQKIVKVERYGYKRNGVVESKAKITISD